MTYQLRYAVLVNTPVEVYVESFPSRELADENLEALSKLDVDGEVTGPTPAIYYTGEDGLQMHLADFEYEQEAIDVLKHLTRTVATPPAVPADYPFQPGGDYPDGNDFVFRSDETVWLELGGKVLWLRPGSNYIEAFAPGDEAGDPIATMIF